MNKSDLIKLVADQCDSSQVTIHRVVDAMLTNIVEALSCDEKVDLHGFGKFKVTKRVARIGRNPKTGEALHIVASKSVSFKPAKVMKGVL
jgi:nucleoid DNA-binding protein